MRGLLTGRGIGRGFPAGFRAIGPITTQLARFRASFGPRRPFRMRGDKTAHPGGSLGRTIVADSNFHEHSSREPRGE